MFCCNPINYWWHIFIIHLYLESLYYVLKRGRETSLSWRRCFQYSTRTNVTTGLYLPQRFFKLCVTILSKEMNENKILYKITNYQCLLAIRKQDTQLYFFLSWEKNWSTNYCVELKKKNPQLKAQQNKGQIPGLSIELKGFQWAHYFYYPALLSQTYSKAVFRHKICCVLAETWAMDQLTWNQ